MKFLLFGPVFLIIFSAVDLQNTSTSFKGNVLNFMLAPSPSHHTWNMRIIKALAEEGYNVTCVSVFVDKKPTKNLHFIYLEKTRAKISSLLQEGTITVSRSFTATPVENLRHFYVWKYHSCVSSIESNGFQTLMNYPDNMKFDLIIYEATTGPCLLPILDKFPKAPLLSTVPMVLGPYAFYHTGSPNFPSLSPHYSYPYPLRNLFDRIYSIFLYATDIYLRKSMISNLDEFIRGYFGPDMKHLGSYESRNEILLVNTHPSMQPALPTLPNLVQVGGLHIRNVSSLPYDIEQFISSSDKGVVLFSLGTNIKFQYLGEEKLQMFINVIRRIPQYNFLWNLNLDSLPLLPKNLMVKNFVPQNDILAHPKVKLFLSHAGLLGTQEAVWHAVPVLAMPFLVDQPMNAYGLVKDGAAEQLDLFTTNEEELYRTITKILNEPSYSEKMKKLSTRFRDRAQPPLNLALFWCRYLIRHGNALHLRSPGMEMSHFAQHMWDVLLVFVGVLLSAAVLVSVLVYVIIKTKKSIRLKKVKLTKQN